MLYLFSLPKKEWSSFENVQCWESIQKLKIQAKQARVSVKHMKKEAIYRTIQDHQALIKMVMLHDGVAVELSQGMFASEK